MIIDSIRLDNIKLAVSLIGIDPEASEEFEFNQIKFWSEQMKFLIKDLKNG